MALRGALTLQRAVAAGRLNRAEESYAYLRHARELADRIGEGRNDHNTEFGPTNVSLHEVSVAVDLGDAGLALRAAQAIDISGLSPERQARFGIDLAKAHAQRRQVDDAVSTLEKVLHAAPELFHTKPTVKQLVTDLQAMSPQPPEQLQALARELGLPEE
ncbi:transcriptional regulator [Streptomyces yaizuensis]|uniref:Tetratricopeptide repeat protein n=1 Tax=Streptomyces yaizuensis TaxID=2989713 RepID=A0ABQ5NVW0_9ACTN|nr:transcriptional regulator [Streptomyces sp. YSPA8]GLF94298.1 hypothetical protein SYYSPA8_08395 [Streptomyces sp. YSPA8]